MKKFTTISAARAAIDEGHVIAYPTEAVYGLGCCPFNQQAVEEVLKLKQRPVELGLIVLIASWEQLTPLIKPLEDSLLEQVAATWPGPVTWLFPKSSLVPSCVSGKHDTLAIRMTAHPIARALCADGPIVSTSANISGISPAITEQELVFQFANKLYGVMEGDLGSAKNPSAIYDVITKNCIRQS